MQPEELERLGFHEEGMKKTWSDATYEGRKEGKRVVAYVRKGEQHVGVAELTITMACFR